jgi:carbonic anhydrase
VLPIVFLLDTLEARVRRFGLIIPIFAVMAAGTGQSVAAESQSGAASLSRLKAGNERYVRGTSEPASIDAPRREVLSKGQQPFAMTLSCADSRVPPEHVFNVGLGDLFVIRTAGEVVDRSILASLEYGAEHLHIPLLVVMGHEACGAVKAAAEKGDASLGPNLDYLVNAIVPAVKRTRQEQGQIKDMILATVEEAINDTLEQSEILRHAHESGSLQIVGAYYDFSGRVVFSEPVTPKVTTTVAPAPAHKH